MSEYRYRSPEGEVVEAGVHEFVTQLKDQGYTLVVDERVEQQDAPSREELSEQDVQVQHEGVEVSQPEQAPETVSEDQLRRRRNRD